MIKAGLKTAGDATPSARSILDAAQATASGMIRAVLKAREITVAKDAPLMGIPATVNGMTRAGRTTAVKIIAAVAPLKIATMVIANVAIKAVSETKAAMAKKIGLTDSPTTGNAMTAAALKTKIKAATIAIKAAVLHPVTIPIGNLMTGAVLKTRMNRIAVIRDARRMRNRTKAVPTMMTAGRIVLLTASIKAITKMKALSAASVFTGIKMKMIAVAMRVTTIPVHDAVVIRNMPTAVSDCILHNRQPEPSGCEGLVDVHVIRSLYESARAGRAVCLERFRRRHRPSARREITRPAKEPLEIVHTEAPNE